MDGALLTEIREVSEEQAVQAQFLKHCGSERSTRIADGVEVRKGWDAESGAAQIMNFRWETGVGKESNK